ncbi:MAG: ferritin family protein [bacterium]|nr:ferritin family protein [bacterium]
MNRTYSLEEIIEIAVKIEEDGVIFYETLANRTKVKGTAETYRYLAGEEKEHIAIFRSIYKDITGRKFEKAFTEEEANLYIHSLVENRIFKNKEEMAKFVENINDEFSVIELAIQIEKDTILYYYEILEGLEDKERNLVKEIINQEKVHIYRLTNLKNILRG